MTKDDVRKLYMDGLARLIPQHMHKGIVAYMERGDNPGTFLSLMLIGDRDQAMGSIDFVNMQKLYEWNIFLRDHLPAEAHGSVLKVAAWRKLGGLAGVPAFIKDMKVGQ